MRNEVNTNVNEKRETNVNDEEITLAPPIELINEAKYIAQNTKDYEKFPFDVQYDINQKDFLIFMLHTISAVIEMENDEKHTISTSMNMAQLAFIKRLECVKRIKTDEGSNPFLEEEAKSFELRATQFNADAVSVENIENLSHSISIVDKIATPVDVVTAKERDMEMATTSAATSSESSCCPGPTNYSKETAQRISDESCTPGYICCPCAEQWFKFRATRTGKYTIYTTGSLDTIGTLYDSKGNKMVEVDDYAPCGKINFRIVKRLTAGTTYYVKVRLNCYDTGSYMLRVTENILADYVTINKNTIVLEKGVLYELPVTTNYVYRGYRGARPITGLSVTISPNDTSNDKIYWREEYGTILDCSYGYDEDGNRFIHVMANDNGIAKLYASDYVGNGRRDECTVYVGGLPVSGITLDRYSKIIGIDQPEQLNATVHPYNALNQEFLWDSSDWDTVEVTIDGIITGIKKGTATVSATTEDGDFVASCLITVDPRPKAVIEIDYEYSTADKTYFNILFDQDKIWRNVGEKLDDSDNNMLWNMIDSEFNTPPERRCMLNSQVDFSAEQLAFAYLCDPFGVKYYLKHYELSSFGKTQADLLWFKDEVYKFIFGEYPHFFKIFPGNTITRYEYAHRDDFSITEDADDYRKNVYSDAEIIFGDHNIIDIFTCAELIYAFFEFVLNDILSINDVFENITKSVDLVDYLFFNGAVENVISTGSSDALEEYMKEIAKMSVSEEEFYSNLEPRIKFIIKVFNFCLTIMQTGIFIPSVDDLKLCNKINSEALIATFAVDDQEFSIQDILNYCET